MALLVRIEKNRYGTSGRHTVNELIPWQSAGGPESTVKQTRKSWVRISRLTVAVRLSTEDDCHVLLKKNFLGFYYVPYRRSTSLAPVASAIHRIRGSFPALVSHIATVRDERRITCQKYGTTFPKIKSDQFRICPAASPEILHHTVRRTWLFIVAYSDERLLYFYQEFSLPHLYISFLRVGRM